MNKLSETIILEYGHVEAPEAVAKAFDLLFKEVAKINKLRKAKHETNSNLRQGIDGQTGARGDNK